MTNLANERQVQKKIGDSTYTLMLLPTKQNIRVAKELTKVILPVMGSMQSGDMAEVALMLVDGMQDIDTDTLIDTLFQGAIRGNEPLDVDNGFFGKPDEFIEVLIYALEQNFHKLFTAKAFEELLEKFLKGKTVSQEDLPDSNKE